MPKTEKIFELLSYIRHSPHLSARELAALCEISERGVYRYLNTLERAGIGVAVDNGYVLRSSPVCDGFSSGELMSVCALLRSAIRTCRNPNVRKDCLRYLECLNRLVSTPCSEIHTPLVILHPSRPSHINPATTYDSISANIMSLVFSSLLKLTDEGALVSDLAREWSVSPDGKTWHFRLRSACFSDGKAVSTSDVAATYERLRQSNVRALRRKYGLIQSINAAGDSLTVTLRRVYGPAACLWTRPVGKAALLNQDECLIGSGPFTATRDGSDIILNANEAYYGSVPGLKQIIFRYVSNATEALQAMKDGEADIVIDLVSPDLVTAGFRTYPILDGTIYAILFDSDVLGKDERVALEDALSKASLLGKNSFSCVPSGPFSTEWANNTDIRPRYRSAEAAIRVLGGKRISLALTDDAVQLKKVAVGIKVQLMKAGVKVTLAGIDSEHDAILCRLNRGPDPDDLGQSISAYCDLPAKELWRMGRSATERREKVYREIHRVMHSTCRAIFLTAGYNYITSRYSIDTRQLTLQQFLEGLKDWRVSHSSEANRPANYVTT